MALQAGRVGVAPDQVDIFGKIKSSSISAEVMNTLYQNIPFLVGKWYRVDLSADGNSYHLTSELDGVELVSSYLILPDSVHVKAYVLGFESLTAVSGESSANLSIQPKNVTGSGKTSFGVPGKSTRFKATLWLNIEANS